jgi:hypothetical protein
MEWVERARGADPRAFRALYELAFRLVFACSLRATGDPRRAERLTAATLKRAFAELAEHDGSLSLGVWLVRRAERSLRAGEDADRLRPPAAAGEPS